MKILNKKFFQEYVPLSTYEAGVVLTGPEVKSIRGGRIRFDDSFVMLTDTGALLINCHIPLYSHASPDIQDPDRQRKLLLTKKELLKIRSELSRQPRLTIAPKSCYTKGGKIKLEIALAKGKRAWEQKSTLKIRSEKRRVEKELKERMRK
ncbi:MAG: SsrA-binding protein SmpB [Candidatus Roizmanbacteria bacterium]